MNTTIYRAADTEPTVAPWTCWARDRQTAERYTEEEIGRGGERVWEVDADLSGLLDIHTGGALSDFAALAEALGYEDPQATADEWKYSGWLYPWEESRVVRRQLAESGYDWLLYTDDYPAGAETLMRITPAEG